MTRSGYRRCTKCEQNRAERFFVGARGRVCSSCRKARTRSASRGKRLLDLYGLTLDEYDALFAAQGGRCAICGGTRRQKLSVDHCHKTGRIRGLLCRQCNGRLLTAARDSIDTLRAAIDYLTTYPCDAVLGPRIVVNAHVKKAVSSGQAEGHQVRAAGSADPAGA